MAPMLAPVGGTTGPVSVVSSLATNLACSMCPSAGSTPACSLLAARFWQDGYGNGDELLILAQRANVLDATSFDDLVAAVTSGPVRVGTLRLASEEPPVRALIAKRLEQLRRSSRRRNSYRDLLGAVWEEMRPAWEGGGSERADEVVKQYRARLARGANWSELAPNPTVSQFMPGVFDRAGHDTAITLIPTLSFGRMFVLDVDASIVVAVPIPDIAGRRGTEQLSQKLRAIAHPTRLALLRDLSAEASSVGQLALRYGLAQPTMTNHIKVLRDAGLVVDSGEAGRRGVTCDVDAVRSLVHELSDLTARPGG